MNNSYNYADFSGLCLTVDEDTKSDDTQQGQSQNINSHTTANAGIENKICINNKCTICSDFF